MTDMALIGAFVFAIIAAIIAADGEASGWSAWRRAVVAALAFPAVFLVYRAVLGGGV